MASFPTNLNSTTAGGHVQISAHYTRDLKRTFRVTARLRRGSIYRFRAIGALIVLFVGLAAWSAVLSTGAIVANAVLGVVVCVLPDVGLWLNLRINREAIVVDVDVEVTDRGICSRTATQCTTIRWEMVKRFLEAGDCWIFVVNRLLVVTLYKSALTPLQRAQLTAFLAGRP